MVPDRGPVVRRRRLGRELRRLREEAGLTGEEVARQLEVTPSTISRTETASSGQISARTVRALLDLYGVTNEEDREGLLAIARDAGKKGWWHSYSDVLPSWSSMYVGLEADAESIRSHHAQLVPSLLQTQDYARAVITSTDRPTTAREGERRVALRMERQQRLTRSDTLHLQAVLDEAVLHRPIGGRDVMRAQLTALARTTELPNVTVQVMPFTATAHPCPDFFFRILGFPDGDPAVVFLEGLTNGTYLEEEEEVARYNRAFEDLRAAALDTEASAALITKTARTL